MIWYPNLGAAVLVVVITVILAAAPGYWIVRWVLASAAQAKDSGPNTDADAAAKTEGPVSAANVLRGGTWIGVLERIAVSTAVVLGYPAAIAFVIAVKGLGRYPELKEHPEASERFVIGTLASMLWATAVGLVGLVILQRMSVMPY